MQKVQNILPKLLNQQKHLVNLILVEFYHDLIEYNNISKEGAASLADSLKINQTLTYLNLGIN